MRRLMELDGRDCETSRRNAHFLVNINRNDVLASSYDGSNKSPDRLTRGTCLIDRVLRI